MTSEPPSRPRPTRSSSRLVQHDIRLEAEVSADGKKCVTALVECQRAGGEIPAQHCARCKRFVRIEPHEAGYLLFCHRDEPRADEGPRENRAEADAEEPLK